MIDYLTKNFLVMSSIALGVGAALSMVFLSAYLAVFDWNLVWLIEYGDLAKLFLIGTALVASISTILINQAHGFYSTVINAATRNKWVAIGLGLLVLAFDGYGIYRDYRLGNGQITYHVNELLSTFVFFFLLWLVFNQLPIWRSLSWGKIVNDLGFFVIALGLFGATFGVYVRDVSKYHRQIITKTDKFDDAKLIMLLSHHVAFLVERRVVVVPSADVVKMVSEPPTRN